LLSVGAVLLGLWCFVAPAAAWWFFVLRRERDDAYDSFVAVAGLSAFVTPASTFVLNRLFGYPLSLEGIAILSTGLVALAALWPRFVGPRLSVLDAWVRRNMARVLPK